MQLSLFAKHYLVYITTNQPDSQCELSTTTLSALYNYILKKYGQKKFDNILDELISVSKNVQTMTMIGLYPPIRNIDICSNIPLTIFVDEILGRFSIYPDDSDSDDDDDDDSDSEYSSDTEQRIQKTIDEENSTTSSDSSNSD